MINFKQHFATTYRHLTKKTTTFVYRSTCLVHLLCLHPYDNLAPNVILSEFFIIIKGNGMFQCSKMPFCIHNEESQYGGTYCIKDICSQRSRRFANVHKGFPMHTTLPEIPYMFQSTSHI